MPRGIDHIAHAVRDLEAAAESYRALGFQVSPRNRHPRAWGTQNHIVQLDGTYIELLGIADVKGIAPHAPRYFSFGAFTRDFLARGEGLSMLALEGRGASDAAEFGANGIGDFELFEFQREGRGPDGTAMTLGFALAFASDANAPDIGFFTSQHRYSEAFWNPAFQQHPNGATRVAGIVMVADAPARHRDFLVKLSGTAASDTEDGFAITTRRGDIEVRTPTVYKRRFGLSAPNASGGARLAAVRFAGANVAPARRLVLGAGLIFEGR
jgi:catechol 2,3-dioxygenase-like lactoylglutathione lyase family enzyme